jgi:hypothetical protein
MKTLLTIPFSVDGAPYGLIGQVTEEDLARFRRPICHCYLVVGCVFWFPERELNYCGQPFSYIDTYSNTAYHSGFCRDCLSDNPAFTGFFEPFACGGYCKVVHLTRGVV